MQTLTRLKLTSDQGWDLIDSLGQMVPFNDNGKLPYMSRRKITDDFDGDRMFQSQDEMGYAVEFAARHPKRIFTVLETDEGGMVVKPGCVLVNRFAYVLVSKDIPDDTPEFPFI